MALCRAAAWRTNTVAESINYFLYTFTSIFTIVNPFGVMPVYLSTTSHLDDSRSLRVARKSVTVAMLIMISFALGGRLIFNFFGISLDALRIVGGILFFMVGYDMLQGKEARTKSIEPEEIDIDAHAISPLAIPAICGPGALTVSTVLAQETNSNLHKGLFLIAILSVGLITFLLLLGSKRIMRAIGNNLNQVFFRLMGLIIMMIAIEFFFKGLKPYVSGLFN